MPVGCTMLDSMSSWIVHKVGVHKPTLGTVTMVPPVPGTGDPVPNMTGPGTCTENMQLNQTKMSVIR